MRLFLAALTALGCETFDPPPSATLEREEGGVLAGWGEPLVVRFSEPVAPETLRVAVMHQDHDPERRLPDEDDDPVTEPRVLFSHGADGATGGTSSLDGRATALTLTPDAPLPLGPALVLVVEPRLADLDGHETLVRTRIPFSYRSDCDPGGAEPSMPSGPWFFVMSIDPPPLRQQLQLFTWFEVSAPGRAFSAQLTDGDRSETLDGRDGCPDCGAGDVCRLLPEPGCDPPSTEMGGPEEFPDFVLSVEPPDGFTFTVTGCANDVDGGATVVVSDLFDFEATAAPGVVVTTVDTEVVGQIRPSGDGRWRGTGAVSVADVAVNDASSGPTQGTFDALQLGEEELREIEARGVALPRPPPP